MPRQTKEGLDTGSFQERCAPRVGIGSMARLQRAVSGLPLAPLLVIVILLLAHPAAVVAGGFSCTANTPYAANFAAATVITVGNSSSLNTELAALSTMPDPNGAILQLTTAGSYTLAAEYAPKGAVCLEPAVAGSITIFPASSVRHLVKNDGSILQAIGLTFEGAGSGFQGGIEVINSGSRGAFIATTFQDCGSLNQRGGGLYVGQSAEAMCANGTQFLNNVNRGIYGGGAHVEDYARLDIGDDILFQGNRQGIAVWLGANVSIGANARFLQNTALLNGGGGIHLNYAGSLSLGPNATFKSNSAGGRGGSGYGGALFIENQNNNNINIAGPVLFEDNYAPHSEGGALSIQNYAGAGDLVFPSDMTFISNSCGGFLTNFGGGAIFVATFSQAQVIFGERYRFINNYATSGLSPNGGAVYSTASHVVMGEDSLWQGNNAGLQGSCIYLFEGSFTLGM